MIFSCEHCEYQSRTKGLLEKHHSSLHCDIKYSCDLCGYQVAMKCKLTGHNQGNLTMHHQSIHEGKKFTKGNLTQHQQTVHISIKYACNLCSYQATQKGDLRRHKDRKHKTV